MKTGRPKLKLDPNAPGLDEMTRRRRRVLADMQRMSPQQLFQLAVRAGIYTKKGNLTKHYKDDAEPQRIEADGLTRLPTSPRQPATIWSMSHRDTNVQALALRTEELAAAAALAGGRVPEWHLDVLDARDAEEGGDSWDVVEARIRERLKAQRRSA